ncbi:helix-turn-helix domain-containing protein [Microbulbifer sp. SA54]|uniref:helix-turn-helix domain-containing protein n=1 Tax=Microbulbifer sp. SA54 TaxID=3401577 RepID=UPI003AAF850C
MPFGRVLRFWRGVYQLSQEELAHRIDSASRHISRLEKGDAQPSKEMVLRIAQALNLGQRDTINLMLFAGYTELSYEMDFHSPEFAHRREEVILGLKALDPNPAVVVDMTGDILMVNRAWAGLQHRLDPRGELDDSNLFDFLFSWADASQVPQDWGGTLTVLMLALQQWLFFCDDENHKIAKLLARLQNSPYVGENWQQQAASRLAGKEFRVNLSLGNGVQSFRVHSYIENLLGPLAFSAIPDLLVMTFCPEDESLDLNNLLDPPPSHRQLFY